MNVWVEVNCCLTSHFDQVFFGFTMLRDSQYLNVPFKLSEIEHQYGNNIHILSDPFLFSLLARFSDPACKQPLVNQLLNRLYSELVKCVVNAEFDTCQNELETRMSEMHPEGKYLASIVNPKSRVVTVALARAGTVPSHICFDALNHILDPEGVRQDHISINRKTDSAEQVIGTNLGGVKIGGGIENAYVFFPDPMGATGSTLKSAMDIYRNEVDGKAKKYIALHLIVTPEYLTMVTKTCPELLVYALRLDRGLSPQKVLDSVPGSHWEDERGLNQKQYIVPGAGGVGELINNSYV